MGLSYYCEFNDHRFPCTDCYAPNPKDVNARCNIKKGEEVVATRTKTISVCDWCGRDGSNFYVQSYNFMTKDQDSHGKTEYDLKSIDLCEHCQPMAYKMLLKGVEK